MFDLFRLLKRGGRRARRSTKQRRNAIGHHRGLALEPLEDRTLLSVAPLNIAPLNVALVSDAVAQAQQVRAAAANGTIAIIYNAGTMTTTGLVDLLDSVSAAHNGDRIGHLGIVTHGGPGEIELGNADDLSLTTLPSQAAALERLRSVLTSDARLDLYSCSVAAGPQGKTFVDELAADTAAAVFASDDPVGTVPGADFVWEYHAGQAGVSGELLSVQELETIPGLCLNLSAPTLSSPASGATGVSTQPTFSWSQVSGNQGYRIVVSTNSSDLTTDPTQTGGTPSNGFNITVGQNTTSYAWTGTLTAGATYYWEVHALGTSLAQAGYWSTEYSFATQPAVTRLAAPWLSRSKARYAHLRDRQRETVIAIGRKVAAARPDIPSAAGTYSALDRVQSSLTAAEAALAELERESVQPELLGVSVSVRVERSAKSRLLRPLHLPCSCSFSRGLPSRAKTRMEGNSKS